MPDKQAARWTENHQNYQDRRVVMTIQMSTSHLDESEAPGIHYLPATWKMKHSTPLANMQFALNLGGWGSSGLEKLLGKEPIES